LAVLLALLQFIGDGVLIYFGYPEAHEDDAERAVRAGLALIEGLGKELPPSQYESASGWQLG